MYCIGLTGTIASGKSTVADFFAQQKIDVINADQIAKALTAKGQPALAEIVHHFGNNVLQTNGELDRRYLRNIIFEHPHERLWLEQLLHPSIRAEIELRRLQCQSPYCIIEIPLLKDRTDFPYLNRVLLVLSTQTLQIARLQTRDNSSPAQALAILAHQPSETEYREVANDIVINNSTTASLHKKLLKLHQSYLHNATH